MAWVALVVSVALSCIDEWKRKSGWCGLSWAIVNTYFGQKNIQLNQPILKLDLTFRGGCNYFLIVCLIIEVAIEPWSNLTSQQSGSFLTGVHFLTNHIREPHYYADWFLAPEDGFDSMHWNIRVNCLFPKFFLTDWAAPTIVSYQFWSYGLISYFQAWQPLG